MRLFIITMVLLTTIGTVFAGNVSVEYIDQDSVIHFWNDYDDYYINATSGIQITNQYDDYWTHNKWCVNYTIGKKINNYCVEELDLSWTLETDNINYVNITGTQTIAGIELIINYYIEDDWESVKIRQQFKNSGVKDVDDSKFIWITEDIRLLGNPINDAIQFYNGTWNTYLLNDTLNISINDIINRTYYLIETPNDYTEFKVRNQWLNKSVNGVSSEPNYVLNILSNEGYNAPLELVLDIGPVLKTETAYAEFLWRDPDYTMTGNSISVSESTVVLRTNVSIEVDAGSKSGDWAVYVNGTNSSGSGQNYIDGDCDDTGDAWKVVDLIEDGTICETNDIESSIANGYIWCDGNAGTGTQIFELEKCNNGYNGNPHTFYSHCEGESASDICSGFGDSIGNVNIVTPPNIDLYTANETEFSTSTPTLQFNGSSYGGSYDLEYNIQIDNVSTFDSNNSVEGYLNITGGALIGVYGDGGTLEELAQSFNLTKSTSLKNIAFYVRKINSPMDNIVMEIYQDSPTGTLIETSESIIGTSLSGTSSYVNFTFDSVNTLNAGTKYYLVMKRTGSRDTSNYYSSYSDSNDMYERGGRRRKDNGVWESTDSLNNDLGFKVYIEDIIINARSDSDLGFANNDTPADTHPFTSGDMMNYTLTSSESDTKIYNNSGNEPDITLITSTYHKQGIGFNTKKSFIMKNASFLIKDFNDGDGDTNALLYQLIDNEISGEPLAKSNFIDATTFNANFEWITFIFNESNQYQTNSNYNYAVLINNTEISIGKSFALSINNPNIFDGQKITMNVATWEYDTNIDFDFQINGDIIGQELSAGTYYWKVKTIDPLGSNDYSDWSEIRQFTISLGNTAPILTAYDTAPDSPISSNDITFNITCSDVDGGDTITGYVNVWNGSTQFGSTQSTTVTSGSNTLLYTLPNTNTDEGETWTGEYWCGDGTVNTTQANNSVTIGSADTCSPDGSSNHKFLCSDNCRIDAIDFTGKEVNITGSGTFKWVRNITNANKIRISGGCLATA